MLSKSRYRLHPNVPVWQRYLGLPHISLNWDNWIIIPISLLLIISFALLYSAGGQKQAILIRHGIHLSLGFTLFLFMSQLSPRFYKQFIPVLYCIGICLLVCVLFFGSTTKGAQRWINLGFMKFQPSEFMKFISPLMLAYYLDDKAFMLKKRHVLISLFLIFLPGLLIAKQPDLGTGLLVIGTGIGVLFFAGLPWNWIFKLGVTGLCALPLLWWKLHDYQRQRIMTFLNPENDPLGSGYHIIQSKIAIGSGGLYGKGWLHGTQAKLNFLPERTTDFIFSVLSEEMGFIGVSILLAIYFTLIARGVLIMVQATDVFNRLMAGGIIFGFFLCIFINIGMVSGLLPVVGCPLPFVSYGGTALMTWMAAFGMLVAIQSQQKK